MDGSTYCGLHKPERAPKCTATAKSSGKQCRKDAIAGSNVCATHGGSASQVKRAALERVITQPKFLEDRARQILDSGVDEVGQLGGLLALTVAALEQIREQVAAQLGPACDKCGRGAGDPQLAGAWFTALERWTARAESTAVNLRKLRIDERFRTLAIDLRTWLASFIERYVPEHRRDAATAELERAAMAPQRDGARPPRPSD